VSLQLERLQQSGLVALPITFARSVRGNAALGTVEEDYDEGSGAETDEDCRVCVIGPVG